MKTKSKYIIKLSKEGSNAYTGEDFSFLEKVKQYFIKKAIKLDNDKRWITSIIQKNFMFLNIWNNEKTLKGKYYSCICKKK